jgi:hypothetical protein
MGKDKQNYMNNPNLPAVGAKFEYTKQQISDLKKCTQNILYFAENFFYIISLDEGRKKIKLYPAQKRALRKMRDNRFFILLASRQIGKALALNTPVPTPNGWVTMGELKEGDKVFDAKGNECNVIKAHPILKNRECYEIVFDSGEKIVADKDHNWFTQDLLERNKGIEGSVKTTEEILKTLHKKGSSEPNHRIPVCLNGVNFPEKELPIDPYILGLWLGDGTNMCSNITVGKRDYNETLKKLKENKQFNKIIEKKYKNNCSYLRPTVTEEIKTKSLQSLLQKKDLLGNKHIPSEYLVSSREQRLELLKGLMDSDGYINKGGIAQFYNTNIRLLNDVMSLIKSLGYKATYKTYKAKFNNKEFDAGNVTFTPIEEVVTLSFKKNRLKLKPKINNSKYRNQWHYIKEVNPVESVPVRCITVDSQDNLFLVGNNYIPTHNSTLMTIYALWIACFNNDQRILIVANKEGTAIELMSRVRLAYEELPNWLKPGVKEYGKTSIQLANGSRIGISTTTGTAARGQSVNVLVLDELAFIENHLVEEFWRSVYPIISSSKKSKIFIASTANGTDNLFYRLYDGALNQTSNWSCDKILWDEVPGRDELWKEETINSLGSYTDFLQEFQCEFVDSGESSINDELYKKLLTKVEEPSYILDDGNYLLWEEPSPEGLYIISVDTSEGIGIDYSVVQIFDYKDITDIKQVAIFASNTISPFNFTQKVYEICQHWGNALVCIERNNCGAQVVDNLRHNFNYENIVSWGASTAGRSKSQLGIISHTNTKQQGVTNMRYYVSELNCVHIRDIKTVKELKDFTRYPNGTWAAKKGSDIHDDRVMSLVWNLIILHDEIAERYLEVVNRDKNNKPLQIKEFDYGLKNFINPTSVYYNEKGGASPNTPPAIIANSQNSYSELESLQEQGWQIL